MPDRDAAKAFLDTNYAESLSSRRRSDFLREVFGRKLAIPRRCSRSRSARPFPVSVGTSDAIRNADYHNEPVPIASSTLPVRSTLQQSNHVTSGDDEDLSACIARISRVCSDLKEGVDTTVVWHSHPRRRVAIEYRPGAREITRISRVSGYWVEHAEPHFVWRGYGIATRTGYWQCQRTGMLVSPVDARDNDF